MTALAERLGLGMVEVVADRIVQANQAFCDLVGLSEAQVLALPSAITLLTPDARGLLTDLYGDGSRAPVTDVRDVDFVDANGRVLPVTLAAAVSPGPGATVNALALVRDRRVDQADAEEVERLTMLLDRLPAGVVVWDGSDVLDPLDLRLALANKVARSTLGDNRSGIVGAKISQVFPGVDRDDAARLLALCGTDRTEHFGEVTYAEERAIPRLYRWDGLGLPGNMVAAIFEDIGAERAGEARRHDLLRRLLESGDEERRKLAMDLHDDAVQQVAAAAILIEGLQRHPGSPHLPERLSSARIALRTAMGGLRRLVFELSPPELMESGLEAAVSSAADYLFAETATTVTTTVAVAGDIPTALTTTAFRITAEALTNVYKHAGATHVDVTVTCRDGNLTIEVADDGIGLQRAGAPGHIGLRTMQERAAAQGGICTISSGGGGRGTVVRAALPAAGGTSMPAPEPGAPMTQDQDLVALRQQVDSVAAAAGEARRDAWQARHQLRTAMAMAEALFDTESTPETVTRQGAELLGQALRAACAIHLLSPDGNTLLRSGSWHSDPEMLAALNAVGFADGRATTPQARMVLNSGEAVSGDLSTASDEVRRQASNLGLEPHGFIVAPLPLDGVTAGTVTVVRLRAPERFTNDDVEFVKCASSLIGFAITRARERAET